MLVTKVYIVISYHSGCISRGSALFTRIPRWFCSSPPVNQDPLNAPPQPGLSAESLSEVRSS